MENVNQSEARRYNRLLSEIDEVYHEVAIRQGFSDSAMVILYALSDNDISAVGRDSQNYPA